MLLPLSRIWSSFATTLLPSAVISLRAERRGRDGQNRNSRRAGKENSGLGLKRKKCPRSFETGRQASRGGSVRAHAGCHSLFDHILEHHVDVHVKPPERSHHLLVRFHDDPDARPHAPIHELGRKQLAGVRGHSLRREGRHVRLASRERVRARGVTSKAASGWTNGACESEDGAQGFPVEQLALFFRFVFFSSPATFSDGPVSDSRDASRRACTRCCRIESGSSGASSLVSPSLSHAAPAPAPAAAPTLHASNPASSSALFSCFPMNTSRDVRASPSSHGRSGIPSNSACTPWNT